METKKAPNRSQAHIKITNQIITRKEQKWKS
nr:MAG TPA: hypothetical protein [Caudoviricetes sp.]